MPAIISNSYILINLGSKQSPPKYYMLHVGDYYMGGKSLIQKSLLCFPMTGTDPVKTLLSGQPYLGEHCSSTQMNADGERVRL